MVVKKPFLIEKNSDWLNELTSANKDIEDMQYHSIEVTTTRAFKETIAKTACSNLQDKGQKLKPKDKQGHLLSFADIKNNLLKRRYHKTQ